MKSIIVIPARYNSTRLPGKPLVEIGGKPMIQLVYEQAAQSELAGDIVVATDDDRIVKAVESFGGNVRLTSTTHSTGTERVIEVAKEFKADIYVNVQGDEPFVNPSDIDRIIEMLQKGRSGISTLCYKAPLAEAEDVNVVKVVRRHNGQALYFSRSLIPFRRQEVDSPYLIHIGIYGYRKEVLQQYSTIPSSPLEASEHLEQLKFLQAGISIEVDVTEKPGPSVDTSDDLKRAETFLLTGEDLSESDRFSEIKMVILDVDGVLSPATLMYGPEGEEFKQFHVRDGKGIQRLQKAGITIAVVSGRGSKPLEKRLDELGITDRYFHTEEKGKACRNLKEKFGLDKSQILYIGDDLNDLPGFQECGICCTVADAPDSIKREADIVMKTPGGGGVIRELSDRILAGH